jgi:hypothetical protein
VVAQSANLWERSVRNLRGAQVLAAESEFGRTPVAEFRPPLGESRGLAVERAAAIDEFSVAESVAGRTYWKVFANPPVLSKSGFEVPHIGTPPGREPRRSAGWSVQ